jgi:hypothetical protein
VSYYLPPAESEPRPRPKVVTLASYLLYAVAALLVMSTVVMISTFSSMTDALQTVEPDATRRADLHNVLQVVLIGSIVLYALIAAFFVVLGVFVGRGSNGMRITTWVIAGLGVLCFGCGAVSGGFASTIQNSQSADQRDAARRVEDAIPGWAHGTSLAISILNTLLLIAVIVLLTLGPANAFFAKLPVAVPGYPAYPAYPQFPNVRPGGIYPGAPTAVDPPPGSPPHWPDPQWPDSQWPGSPPSDPNNPPNR